MLTRYRCRYWLLGSAALALSGCHKETVKIKEVEVPMHKSWSEVPSFYGIERVVLSMGSNGQALFLQQPFFFTDMRGSSRPGQIRVYGAGLPTDIGVRLSLAPSFFAFPASDTTLAISLTAAPLRWAATVPLRRLDRQATRFQTRYLDLFKCTAISRNNVVLIAYDNNDAAHPITLLLVSVDATQPNPLRQTRTVRIPVNASVGGTYVRNLFAIDDYFLADLGDAGWYRIAEDGSYRQVYARSPLVDAVYKYRGTVYAHAEWERVLTSSDNGYTWQEYANVSPIFNSSTFYTIGDSLIGCASGSALYTVRWHGLTYQLRALAADGLERSTVTGIAPLRDSVFVATINGVFVRSHQEFFRTKQ